MQMLFRLIYLFAILAAGLLSSCEYKPPINKATIPVKDACDNPDADIKCCFNNMSDNLSPIMYISKAKEPGEKLLIKGTIYQSDGRTPYPNVILYAYHTDNTGHYTKSGSETGIQKWHGRLHGWCKTDKNGHYEIHTIKPAPYPNEKIPAHIHCAIKEPDGQKEENKLTNKQDNSSPPQLLTSTYYINDFVFADDSLVNEDYISSLILSGGTGVVHLVKIKEIWEGNRNITLK